MMYTGRRLTGVMLTGLGVLAIGWFVWNIGLTYLGLVTATATVEESSSKDKTTNEVLILEEIRFWTCQIGVYSQQENAELALKQLNALGLELPAALFSSDPWALGVGYALQAEDLSNLKTQLEVSGLSPYLKEVRIPEQHFRIEGQNVRLTTAVLTGINALLNADQDSPIWNHTLEYLDQRFKLELPWQLYPLREEFKRLVSVGVEEGSLGRIGLLKEYRQVLDLLTITDWKEPVKNSLSEIHFKEI